MDNIKNDSYYIEKIVNDLRFISFHMADVTLEQVHNAGEHYERSDTEQLSYIY